MMPVHGTRKPATVDGLAGRVSAGGAGGAEGSFVGCQGHACRLLLCGHVRGCGGARLCSELPLGCRCTPISHVAVPSGGGVTQLWTWGGSMHFLACLNDRNGSACARRTCEIWAREPTPLSLPRRFRVKFDPLHMFLGCSVMLNQCPSTWYRPLVLNLSFKNHPLGS